jgi:RimJ/RimL family protein N-acetyltransferase
MSRLIYGDDERLIAWAADRIGVIGFREDARAIGHADEDDNLLAVTVFDGFSAVDCNIHIASDGRGHWLTRAFLAASFGYPFIQCGLRRVTGLVPATNRAALRFDEHLGFRREGYHPQANPKGGDLISLGMLREWCRFIPQEPRP